jgi:4-amino-4-deoxy-L-arabinose transferase-like glycosyltransferase
MSEARWARPVLLVAVVCLPAVLSVVWLYHFRFGYGTSWDESGYLARGFNDTHALLTGGPVKLVSEYEQQNLEAPLVPLLSVPITAVSGLGVFQGLLLLPLLAALLTLVTYALARRIVSWPWALLAAFVIATMPVVADYSREFVFAVPAALFLTAALWALLSSDGLRNARWVWLAGAMAGLLVLARTMTVSFLPALAVAALVLLLGSRDDRRRRTINLLVGAGIAVFVAASWYLRNWRSVYDYLTSSGYGSTSGQYGRRTSILSLHFWTRELALMANETYGPLGLLLLVCLLLGVGAWLVRTRGGTARPAVLALAVVVGLGYLVLTSSANEGTAFALPLLPPLAVLAVAALATLPWRATAVTLATLLAVVAGANLLMKSGSVAPLATVRSVHAPVLGRVAVTDGRGLLQVWSGASARPPDSQLPAVDRRWPPFSRALTGWIARYAAAHGERPYVLTATDHQFTNQTWISLADSLWFHDNVFAFWPGPATAGETVSQYRALFERYPANVVETTSGARPRGRPLFDHVRAARALALLGFRQVKTFRMPDGKLAWLWWRPSRSEA